MEYRSGTQASRRRLIRRFPSNGLRYSRTSSGSTWLTWLVQLDRHSAAGRRRLPLLAALWVIPARPRSRRWPACSWVRKASWSTTPDSWAPPPPRPSTSMRLPFLFEWIRYGSWRAFLKAIVLFAAAAAAHHATLLFGSFFFALPVVALAFIDRREGDAQPQRRRSSRARWGLWSVVDGEQSRWCCCRSGSR